MVDAWRIAASGLVLVIACLLTAFAYISLHGYLSDLLGRIRSMFKRDGIDG